MFCWDRRDRVGQCPWFCSACDPSHPPCPFPPTAPTPHPHLPPPATTPPPAPPSHPTPTPPRLPAHPQPLAFTHKHAGVLCLPVQVFTACCLTFLPCLPALYALCHAPAWCLLFPLPSQPTTLPTYFRPAAFPPSTILPFFFSPMPHHTPHATMLAFPCLPTVPFILCWHCLCLPTCTLHYYTTTNPKTWASMAG